MVSWRGASVYVRLELFAHVVLEFPHVEDVILIEDLDELGQ